MSIVVRNNANNIRSYAADLNGGGGLLLLQVGRQRRRQVKLHLFYFLREVGMY